MPLGVNYVGFINQQLRSLIGATSLANELIQNADDAQVVEGSDKTTMAFDFTDNDLIVRNNRRFSSCADLKAVICKNEGDNWCDFHRFRNVASGNKRTDKENIGAFGIGFTAVYQITDKPELSSGEFRWTIDPSAPEDKRIEQQTRPELDGTEFRFPWAQAETDLRKSLQVRPITAKEIEAYLSEILASLPASLLFLRHIDSIEILKNGRRLELITAHRNPDSVELVFESGTKKRWVYLKGDFSPEVQQKLYPEKRKTEVCIAVPLDDIHADGRLFAFLPLEREETRLPFQINADFFPSPERKSLLFGQDYQGEWNRIALKKASQIFGNNIRKLKEDLSPDDFWKMLDLVWKVGEESSRTQEIEGGRKQQFSMFWEEAKAVLATFPSVYTSKSGWECPQNIRLVRKKLEKERLTISVLEDLGIGLVSPMLWPSRQVLSSHDVGVGEVELDEIIETINGSQLRRRTPIESTPTWLRDSNKRTALLDEIKFLFEKSKKAENYRAKLSECPLAIRFDDCVDSPKSLFKTSDAKLIDILIKLGFDWRFASKDNHDFIVKLVKELTVEDAVDLLESAEANEIEELARNSRESYKYLINWLLSRPHELSDATKQVLKSLAIWPSTDGFKTLNELVVRGDFDDHLGLASLVDIEFLGIDSSKLIEIGATSLTFESYLDQVQSYFQKHPDTDSETRKKLLALVREKKAEWRDDDKLRVVVSSLPIVECANNKFFPSGKVYFDDQKVKALLGNRAAYLLADDKDKEFFELLGVAKEPRILDLVSTVEWATSNFPDKERQARVVSIIRHVGSRFDELKKTGDIKQWDRLKEKSWLPCYGRLLNWHKPTDQIFSPQKKYLFELVGKFVDLESGVSEGGKVPAGVYAFLKYLDVKEKPEVSMVVNHLRKMVDESKGVDRRVYEFLNEHYSDAEVIQLKQSPCIWISEPKKYVRAEKLFWSDHKFGEYRHKLSGELAEYEDLFKAWDVTKEPQVDDAVKVLGEIAADFLASNQEPLDDEAKNIVENCWLFLFENEASDEKCRELADVHSVLTLSHRLDLPKNVFFDNRPEIPEKIGLKQNAIRIKPRIWKPMQKAGVQFLSEVIETSIIEKRGGIPATQYQAVLGWTDCFDRIVSKARDEDSEFPIDLAKLGDLKLFCVNELLVQYSIPESSYKSGREEADSVFNANSYQIFFKKGSESGLSREIAQAICQAPDVSDLASKILNFLGKDREEDAHKILDGLGYPRVDTSKIVTPISSEVSGIGSQGESTDLVEEALAPSQIEETRDNGSSSNNLDGSRVKTERSELPGKPSNSGIDYLEGVEFTDAAGQGTHEVRRTADRPQSSRKPSKGSKLERPEYAASKRVSNRKGRFPVYVYDDSVEETESENPEKQRHRENVEKEGIAKVMKYESDCQRDPDDLLRNNPGYDILSADPLEGVRYIEVKASSSYWGESGVGLTRREFEEAVVKGNKYWLYVVENVFGENCRIYRIQNPAGLVNTYFFDHTWKKLSD